MQGAACVRKEFRQLSDIERNRLRTAMLALHTTVPDLKKPDDSEYDIFVMWHQMSSSPGAHRGAAFLPWHREYLKRYYQDFASYFSHSEPNKFGYAEVFGNDNI